MGVLVTGGAGYIGSHMVLDLLEAGERPVVVDNLATGVRWAVPDGVVFEEGDVGDRAFMRDVIERHDITEILHFAASTVVPESEKNPLKYYLNNTVNSASLITTALETGVKRFIFSSTAAVYGDAETTMVDETAPLGPISPYGRSKMMTEQVLADAARAHDFSYVTLRYFNVAGGDPMGRVGQSTPGATHLIKVACQAALGQRDALTIFGEDYDTRDGTGERDYIHVTDLAAAHREALAYLRAGGLSETFNCGYGRGATVREVIRAVEKVAGHALPVETADRRPGDIGALIADAGKIRSTLSWRPQFDDLDRIVAHAYAWERRLMAGEAEPTRIAAGS